MDYLFIANTIVIGIFHVMWKREGWFNTVIKLTLFALLVFNIIRLTTGQV